MSKEPTAEEWKAQLRITEQQLRVLLKDYRLMQSEVAKLMDENALLKGYKYKYENKGATS